MFRDDLPLSPSRRRFLVSPFPHVQRGLRHQRFLYCCLLSILLLAQLLDGWASPLPSAFAAGHPHPHAQPVPGTLTLQKFLHEGRSDHAYHGPFRLPSHPTQAPGWNRVPHQPDAAHLPPSAEPATMKPLTHVLTPTFLAGGAGVKPLDLRGSDQRLEVQIQPGSFDLSHATTSTGKPVTGTITLNVTQAYGHFPGQVNLLGSYTLQLLDQQGHPLQGVQLHTPITYVYHYQSWEMTVLDLDPGTILLSFPLLLATARAHHHATDDLAVMMQNDPTTSTLTAQSHGVGPFDLGSGTDNQSPPVPHLASVGGNSGQLSYSYPLTLAPGPPGAVPSLTLTYSSESTNERTSTASPSGSVGEGWSLSMGSITADVYTNQDAGGARTWYSMNGVAGVSDRLVANPSDQTSFLTQHISPLKILQVQSNFGQPCFDVWDASGSEYIFGCTPDSLQYYTKSDHTRVNYRWDLDQVLLANEGPGTGNVSLQLRYLQDSTTSNGDTTIHDAVMWQMTSFSNGGTVASTVDFFYRGRTDQSIGGVSRSQAYGTNYNCTAVPKHPVPNPPTILRCDDPLDFGGSGLNAPQVLSTYSLQTIKSYVGTDLSTNNQAYGYSFTYTDHPYWSCYDDWTQNQMNCAGDHLLTSVVPTAYLKGVAYPRKGVSLLYTTATHPDDYFDTTHPLPSIPSQYFHQTTFWNYLSSYLDTETGEGASITYELAYSNTHGTPATNDDNRVDPFYCDKHINDSQTNCTGAFAYPDDRAWAYQVVTSITSSGSDSSSVAAATSGYAYGLTITSTSSCPDYQGDTRCVGDNWMPTGSSDFLSYYQAEYRGFGNVYLSSPANNVTAQTYYATAGWATNANSFFNYLGGSLAQEESYLGNATSGSLLRETKNTYAGVIPGENDSCNGNYSGLYTPCAVLVLISRTTSPEGNTHLTAPWMQEDNSYDDYVNQPHESLGAGYNNLVTEVISSSNAPTLTKNWTYTPNDQTVGSWVYHE